MIGITTYLLTQVGLNLAVQSGAEPADDPVFAEKFAVLARRPEFFAPTATGPRVLILGSSRTQHGVDAGRLAGCLGPGVAAFNFGTPAGGPLTNALYLRRLLGEGVRAELLLVEIHPGYLAPGDPPFEARWLRSSRLRAGEAAVLAELGHPVAEPAHLGPLGWVAASSVYRAGLAGRHAPLFHPNPGGLPLGQAHDRNGFVPGPPLNPKYKSLGLKATRRQYEDVFADYAVGGPGCAALRRIVHDAHAAGMKVRFFVTAEDEPLRQWYGAAGNAALAKFVAGLAAESGSPAIDGRDWLGGDDFIDGHHATPEGAAKFTDRLAEALAPSLTKGTP